MSDVLSRLDLAFCVDLTGSMSGFIAAAKEHMSRVLEALQHELKDGLRVAIVGYRDHSDGKNLLEVHPLDANLKAVSKAVAKLSTSGGGDAPEAVYAGLKACLELKWSDGSYRVIILVGDAPPHGVGAPGDSYARGDPTGYSLDDMANELETEGLFVHALSMQPGDRILAESFKRLSISTGGSYQDTKGGGAMGIVEAVTRALLADIDFDRKLLAKLREGVPMPVPKNDDELVPSRAEVLAKLLKVEMQQVHGGMMRLRRRRLLEGVDA